MRAALVLRRDGAFGRHNRFGEGRLANDVSVKRRQGLTRLVASKVSLSTPGFPVTTPRSETILLIIDAVMDLPFKSEEPLEFQLVQLCDRNIANFSPRFVLESIIIQEFASEQQSHSQHAVDLATARLEDALRREHPHAAGQIKES